MKKLELDKEIRNPILDMPNMMTLEYKSPSETIIVQPSNREIADKVNEIIEALTSLTTKDDTNK